MCSLARSGDHPARGLPPNCTAAGAQGRFWDMHDLLFAHQDQLELEDLAGYAGRLGLEVEEFLRDIDEQRHASRIREDVADAEASGARGTPTFFVGNRRHQGPYDARSLITELEAAQHGDQEIDSTR
jgi:protein-disulfide isomerase